MANGARLAALTHKKVALDMGHDVPPGFLRIGWRPGLSSSITTRPMTRSAIWRWNSVASSLKSMRQVDLSSQLPIEMPWMGATWAISLCTLVASTGTARPRSVRISLFAFADDIGLTCVLGVPVLETEAVDDRLGGQMLLGRSLGRKVDAPGAAVLPIADAHPEKVRTGRCNRIVDIRYRHARVAQFDL